MLRGIIIITVVGILGLLSYRHSRFQERIFKRLPLVDWIYIIGIPVGLYLGWVILIRNILDRPFKPIIPFDDFDILSVTILFIIYGFVGVGVHFTSKILWRYLSDDKQSIIYQINEMFHNKISHYLGYLNGLFIFFMVAIIEINHPLQEPITKLYAVPIILVGILFGVVVSKTVIYTNEWFGGYNKPLSFVTFLLLVLLFNISRLFKLHYLYYPIKLFVTTALLSSFMTYVIRQVMIFTRLSSKKRLRFLAKILSA